MPVETSTRPHVLTKVWRKRSNLNKIKTMVVLIYGSGAVGLGLASCLLKAGVEVDLIDKDEEIVASQTVLSAYTYVCSMSTRAREKECL